MFWRSRFFWGGNFASKIFGRFFASKMSFGGRKEYWVANLFWRGKILGEKNFESKFLSLIVSPLDYSRLSLFRTSRDSLKYIEIPVLRHIRFPELREKSNNQCPKFMCISTPLHIYIKLLWKRGEIAPEEQFLLLSTIFLTCC